MIYKQFLGYSYVGTNDKKLQAILFAYCEGRSILWRMFLGWRKTSSNNVALFWIPSHKLNSLIYIAKGA